jgi:hypothetical protein
MDVLAENDGKVFWRATIDRPGAFTSPFSGALFPCLIWDHDGHFTDTARSAIAKALLEAGCRYAVCGGRNCAGWHEAVDAEFVKAHIDDPKDVWESAHVMTTWHDGESPDDVAFFFVLNTNFDDHDFRRYLVLHVGTGPLRDQIEAAIRKYALSNNAV